MLQHVSALVIGRLQGDLSFLTCATCVPTFMVEILHMIKIFVIKINYHNF